MTNTQIQDNKQAPTSIGRCGIVRLSAMALITAGAIGAANQAKAQADITDAASLTANLNTTEDLTFLNDVDLLGATYNVTLRTQFFGDTGTEVISNGTVNVTGSTSVTNYVLLDITPGVIFNGDVTLDAFSRLDIDAPSALGATGTVTAAANTDIRLFTADAGTSTWDGAFFAKITGVADSTSFSITGNGISTLTALPTFDALINLNQYNDFDDYAADPDTDPTLTLGANLSGNHAVNINFGTLDLADFDFTIDSLAGVENTEITLGAGTLTTGDDTDTTYAGIISGTGDLTKTGTGTFTLTGVNTYTGTTTVSAGILALEADQTGPTAVVIGNGGTLQVNVDQTGVPTYTVQNGGVLDLFADLADTTPVTIDAGGMLNLNDVDQTLASIAGGGDISLGTAALTVGDANDTALSGIITGSGSLTKVGAGNLTLSGTNTYTGNTTISAGTLTLDGDLSNNAAVAIAAGATLDLNDNNETLGTITGTGDITLGSATLTVGNGSNFTFGGIISETGGLTKQGTGTLTLSAAQTYTGATLLTGGTLVANADLATSGVTINDGATFALESELTDAGADVTVDDGGTLYGTGTIGNDLNNNGTVTFIGPGAGDILTVNGDYNQGGTGVLNVQLGNPTGLVVTGTATFDGTLNISAPADPANFDIDDTYDIVTAGGTAGDFATVTDDFAFLDVSTNVAGGAFEIDLARNAVALSDITTTVNQTTVANVLDSIVGPTGNLDSAIDRILASSEADALKTMDQLAGAGAATISTQLNASVAMQGHRLLDQVGGTAPGSSRPAGAFSQAPSTSNFDDADHLTLLSFAQDSPEQTPATESGLSPMPWGTFYGGFGDQGDGAEGVDYIRYGLLAGVDFTADESDARYGLALGVEQSDFELNRDNGDIDIQSIYLSAYTRQPLGNDFNITLSGTFGYHGHDSTRNILIGVNPTQAKADFNSTSISVAAELSKAFHFEHTPTDPGSHPTATTLEPFVRLDYTLSSQDGYSETGAGNAGLNVGGNDFDSSRVAAGLRVEHQYMLFNQHEAVLRGSALANFALLNSDSDLSVSFVNTPNTGFEIAGSDQDDIFGQIGVGLSVEINHYWDIHFDMDQHFADNAMGTTLAASLSYTF